MKAVVIFLSLLIIFFIGIFLTKDGQILFYTIFPPSDYHDDLVFDSFDITKKNSVKSFEFEHKYYGKYQLQLLLENYKKLHFLDFKNKYYPSLKIEVSFYLNNDIVIKKTSEKLTQSFIAKNKGGYGLIYYKTPEDLPLDKVLKCDIKVIEPDVELAKRFGPVKISIAKISDL